jgi:hypothetical protein
VWEVPRRSGLQGRALRERAIARIAIVTTRTVIIITVTMNMMITTIVIIIDIKEDSSCTQPHVMQTLHWG